VETVSVAASSFSVILAVNVGIRRMTDITIRIFWNRGRPGQGWCRVCYPLHGLRYVHHETILRTYENSLEADLFKPPSISSPLIPFTIPTTTTNLTLGPLRARLAAGALFANSVIRGMNGEKGVVTPTFVKSPLYEDQGIEYFSSNVELGVSRRRLFF
jgi:hypothetical protein